MSYRVIEQHPCREITGNICDLVPRLTRIAPVGCRIDLEDSDFLSLCFARQCRQASAVSGIISGRRSECEMERCSPLLRSIMYH